VASRWASTGWVHLALAGLIVAGVFAQVYLIGAYIFGAGQGALDAHRPLGFTVHGFEVLLFLAALLAWPFSVDLALSLLVTLADSRGWVGGLHPLGALVVLALAVVVARRGLRGQRVSPAGGAN
jgi:hypothetical protein